MIIRRSYYFVPERAHVRFRIRWSGNTYDCYIPVRVDPTKWSKDTRRCKNNTTHSGITASEINRELNRYENAAEVAINKFASNDHIPTRDELKHEMNVLLNIRERNTSNKSDFFEYFEKFIIDESVIKEWTQSTIDTLYVYIHRLQRWRPLIYINSVNDQFLTELMRHLIDSGYRNSTTAKTIEVVKWYLRWLKKKGLYNGNSHETFLPKIKGREKKEAEVFLTWDELTMLYNAELESVALQQVRDVFCFCCFTSLRYSDVAKLQRSDVFNEYIFSVTKKTNDRLTIQLNKYAKAILERYKDFRFKNNLALPIISNQKMNEQLKVLAKLVGLNDSVRSVYFVGNERHEVVTEKWRLITTHAARRTFIVNALALGIPSEVVMKWSGHADHESMLPYIAIVEKLKEKEMERFNKD